MPRRNRSAKKKFESQNKNENSREVNNPNSSDNNASTSSVPQGQGSSGTRNSQRQGTQQTPSDRSRPSNSQALQDLPIQEDYFGDEQKKSSSQSSKGRKSSTETLSEGNSCAREAQSRNKSQGKSQNKETEARSCQTEAQSTSTASTSSLGGLEFWSPENLDLLSKTINSLRLKSGLTSPLNEQRSSVSTDEETRNYEITKGKKSTPHEGLTFFAKEKPPNLEADFSFGSSDGVETLSDPNSSNPESSHKNSGAKEKQNPATYENSESGSREDSDIEEPESFEVLTFERGSKNLVVSEGINLRDEISSAMEDADGADRLVVAKGIDLEDELEDAMRDVNDTERVKASESTDLEDEIREAMKDLK